MGIVGQFISQGSEEFTKQFNSICAKAVGIDEREIFALAHVLNKECKMVCVRDRMLFYHNDVLLLEFFDIKVNNAYVEKNTIHIEITQNYIDHTGRVANVRETTDKKS